MKPTVEKLMTKVSSKYTLVVLTAKRAREISGDDEVLLAKGEKPVMRALSEIAEGTVSYEQL
ncbi:MAG: DNA-directed RNA polymerase subunit omega [Clostridia bacterium]